MKILKFLSVIILAAVIAAGCDKPAPTELVPDENIDDPLQVEVIAKDTTNEVYINGYDTTGVVEDIFRFTNVITLSGVKVTYKGSTVESSIARTIFFDKNFPVYSPAGVLVGYRTRTPGEVEFNNKKTRRVPLIVSYRRGGNNADTLLGLHYLLFNKSNLPLDPFSFPYGSSVQFSYNPLIGQTVKFPILTPPEMNASIKLTGQQVNNTLSVHLNWNKSALNKVEVIIGVMRPGKRESLPLYRLKTKDDGKLIIPGRLLSNIPKNRYDRVVFTISRRYEKNVIEKDVELKILSQSTHSIIADIP